MDESYHNLLAAGIEKKYRALELSIMEDVVRRIQKAGKITSTADWQIQRLVILGSSTEDIKALVAEAVDGNEETVRELYADVIENEYTSQKAIYEAAGKEFIPYEKNAELHQITEALIRQSTDEISNITKSTGFMVDLGNGKMVFTPLSDIYNDYLDESITGMATGAYDYNTLIRKTTSMMTRSGLRSNYAFSDTRTDYGIDYASGRHNRIDVAVRRALLTGFGQLAGRVTEMNAQQLNTNLFEVSAHAAARPSHAEWQGRVWTKQQLTEVCGLGSGGGLCGWNCRHSYYPFVKGISQRNYTDADLEAMATKEARTRKFRGKEYNAYEATQKQRQIETALRAKREKVQLLRQAHADRDDIVEAQCRYQAQLDEYKSFCQFMGLEKQTERIYTGRTPGRIAPGAETYAKWQAEQIQKAIERQEKRRREDMDAAQKAADHVKWLKDIGATSTTLDTLEKFKEAKHNNTEEYRLLYGYGQAVEKGDISPLIGLDQYKRTAEDVKARVLGRTTADGVRIDDYATHFIDRVIGQTAEPHEGMREATSVEAVNDALAHPKQTTERTTSDGDVRRTYKGTTANVTVSVRDNCLIQANPGGSRK